MPQVSVRDMIFEAGQAEFHERGYTATGIAAITARAAAHKGSFYNHFASKEDLAVEALRAYAARQHLDILQDADLEPIERVRTHFEVLARTMANSPVINGCMLANFAAESSDETPLLREQIAGIYGAWSALIAENIQSAARATGLAGVDGAALAWTLLDGFQGAALRARATRSGASLENFLEATLPLVLSTVTSSP